MKQRSLRRRAGGRLFVLALRLVARLARSPAGGLVPIALAPVARLVRRHRGASSAHPDPGSAAREWQRAMPNPTHTPIVRVDGDTAFAEIRTRCPLRGTGDLRACHRVMAYDRVLVRDANYRFLVLRSQAEPGVEVCSVALQRLDGASDAFEEAHVRVERLLRTERRVSAT